MSDYVIHPVNERGTDGVTVTAGGGEPLRCCLRDATEGWGADVVFECSASPRAFADALAATRKGGTMVQFGVFTQEVPLHPADLMLKS